MTISTLSGIGQQNDLTILALIFVLVIVSLVELFLPLHARGRWNRVHPGPNRTLTGYTCSI